MKVCFSLAILIYIVLQPSQAHAGFFSNLITQVLGSQAQADVVAPTPESTIIHNSQNVPLLESSINPDLKNIKDETPLPKDDTVLSSNGALGADSSDLEKFASTDKISTYVVKKGDTLEGISIKLKVPKSTILSSNADLKKSDLLKIGQKLVILAIKDTTKADSTDKTATAKKDEKPKTAPIKELAVKDDEPKDETPTPAEVPAPAPTSLPAPVVNDQVPPVSQPLVGNTPTPEQQQSSINIQVETPVLLTTPVTPPTPPVADTGQPSGTINGGYIWPFPAGVGRVSQGLHADNAYDFAAPKGTPIYAIQSGTVLIAHPSGYNGGYGLYVVINFNDGRQAIFGHMSKVVVESGDIVKQGDIIGYVGSTGKSTGPHCHIGFHGDLGNPYLGLKVNSTDVTSND